jgi:hypothetical protein
MNGSSIATRRGVNVRLTSLRRRSIEALDLRPFGGTVRLPIKRRGDDVAKARQRIEAQRLVAIERRMIAQPPIGRVGILVKLVRERIQLHAPHSVAP